MRAMVHPDLSKWSLSLDTLTELSIYAPHPRTRERFLALTWLAQGECAAGVHRALGRDVHTVLKWVHTFNEVGPSALIYRHSGGTPARTQALLPLLQETVEQARAAAALPVSKKRPSCC